MHFYIDKNKLFSIAYFIFGFFFLIQQTTYFKNLVPNFLISIVIVTVIFIIMLKEVGIVISHKDLYLSSFGLIFAVLYLLVAIKEMSYSTGSIFLLSCVLTFSARDIKLKYLLIPFLIFSSLTFIATFLCSKLGLIQNMISYQHRWRNSLGFSYVSFPAQLCFYFILVYIVYKKNISYKEILFLLILNIYIFIKTATSSPFYLAMLMIVYIFLKKITNLDLLSNRIFRLFVPFIFIIAPLILLWICYCAPSKLFFRINSLTGNRLILSVNGLQNYGVHLGGQKIQFYTLDQFGHFSSNYNFIDSSYIQLMVIYGILYTILILILLTVTMFSILKMKNEVLIIAMVLIAVHSMFDPQMLVLWYSPFMLLIGRSFIYPNVLE